MGVRREQRVNAGKPAPRRRRRDGGTLHAAFVGGMRRVEREPARWDVPGAGVTATSAELLAGGCERAGGESGGPAPTPVTAMRAAS